MIEYVIRNGIPMFAGGFLFGVTGVVNRIRDKSDLLEATLTQEEIGKDGLDNLNCGRRIERDLEFITNLAIPFLYSTLLHNSASGFLAETLTSVVSYNLGNMAGRAARYLTRKSYRADLETARKIRDNPDRALDFIPEKQREKVQHELRTFEEKLMGEGLDLDSFRADQDKQKIMLSPIHSVAVEGNKPYSGLVARYTLQHLKIIFESVENARKIRDFCEADNYGVIMIGNPEKVTNWNRANILELNGQSYLRYDVDLQNVAMQSVKRGRVAVLDVTHPEPKFSEPLESKFEGDYLRIGKDIHSLNGREVCIFVRSPDGSPLERRMEIVTEHLLVTSFTIQDALSRKRKEDIGDKEEN
jgi:hypothetical protein